MENIFKEIYLLSFMLKCILSIFPDISQTLVAMEPWIAKDSNYLVTVYSRMHALIQGTHG